MGERLREKLMLRGLYSAANAMRYRAHEVDVTANNLANVSTDGFKRDRIAMRAFGDILAARINDQSDDRPVSFPPGVNYIGIMNLGGPAVETEFIDFSPGRPQVTDNPLDLMLRGPGFFTIETPGGERYTRSGKFTLSSDGIIINPAGQPLLGVNGQPIRLTSPSPIFIHSNGEIVQDGLPVARIRVVEFSDIGNLEKEGFSMFRVKDPTNMAPLPAFQTSMEQGVLEGSNVDPIDALVQLITAQRAYEAAARAVDMFNQSMNRVSSELGRLPA
ncbi:MAG TPA: flagellar hook-basal body protein [Firmicutes bacterium]|nr:flagellar hook-basal body protein [Bacillota bacterium]